MYVGIDRHIETYIIYAKISICHILIWKSLFKEYRMLFKGYTMDDSSSKFLFYIDVYFDTGMKKKVSL